MRESVRERERESVRETDGERESWRIATDYVRYGKVRALGERAIGIHRKEGTPRWNEPR